MGLILPILVLGLLASLSPSTLVVFILLLATTRARINAGAFLIGWTISVTVVFAVSYGLGAFHPTGHGSTAVAVDIAEILVGIALVALAAWQWKRRNLPRRDDGVSKDLGDRLKRLDPWGAAILGVLKQPWTLTAAAAVVVVRHHSAFVVTLIAFVFFTVVSTATVGAMYVYYYREPGEAQARLASLRARVVRAGPALVAGVSLLVGVLLAIDGVIGLAA